jgi:hypothetical protein
MLSKFPSQALAAMRAALELPEDSVSRYYQQNPIRDAHSTLRPLISDLVWFHNLHRSQHEDH